MIIELAYESADLHGKDLTESEDHFTVTDVLLPENPVILSVKTLQEELDVVLSDIKIENGFTHHNKWLATVLIASFMVF